MRLVIWWGILAVVVGFVAGARGRSGFGWFLISLILSPLIGLLIVMVLPKRGEAAAPRDESGEVITSKSHVRCPDCRELVRHDARKCKHCGTALIPQ